MTFRGSRRILVASLLTVGLLFFKNTGLAQQITYYDFDAPQASNGSSLACGDPAKGPLSTPNPLFCFNNGGGADPGFLSDLYPAIIDPVSTDNPPVDSTHFAVQLTPSAVRQAASMWFNVPQKISDGFTSYFAFKFTPNQASFATADGIAFAIQNAQGGGSESNPFEPPCLELGSGPNAVGGIGGCMGYGGLDNSLVFELDTFKNDWDPTDSNVSTYNTSVFNGNHAAVQNCGAGLGNSPDHTGSCLVKLNNGVLSAINGHLPVTLADGNVHQVVVQYSGPTEAVPNLLQIFIDPPFVPETHTPAADAVPVISGTYDISANLNLMNSGSANDSAYVGFTSATGDAFEQHELMAWTFTPHTPVTQQQPLAPPGQTTTFPFGSHTYAVTYPLNGPGTDNIDMVVTANTISPALFLRLISGTPFDGSICQTYDETGGNCIVYSVSCVHHDSQTITQCPASTDDQPPIDLKSAYNNTIQPISPGFIKGDPFYSQIKTITGNGASATVNCVGDCSVTSGQTITIAENLNGPAAFNGTFTVATADPTVPDTFTFASTSSGSGTGGYVTSNHLENAFTSYVPQRIDGTTTGRTKNFSDFVVTSVTSAVTSIAIAAPSVAYGNSAPVTVTVSSLGGTPTGNVSLTVDGGSPLTQTLADGVTVFSIPNLSAGAHSLSASYAAQDIFRAATQTATLNVGKATSAITTISNTPNPSGVGVAVTVSFKVTGSGAVAPSSSFSVSGAAGDPSCGGNLSLAGTGSCSLTFLTSGARTITVTYNGDSNYSGSHATVQQNVSGPVASVSPGSINFGTVYLGTLSLKSVTLTNVGNAPMTIKEKFLSIVGGGNSNEFVALSLCPSTLNPGKSCTILVTFIAGPAFTTQTATLMINDNAPDSPQSVGLTANVINPQASFNPSSLNFGTQSVGSSSQASILVTNSGNTPLNITHYGISGVNASDFMLINSTCTGALAAKASCSLTLRFVPARSGARSATLTVSDNVWNGSQQVPLSGKGR